jgi:hypothetical protein
VTDQLKRAAAYSFLCALPVIVLAFVAVIESAVGR